MITNFELINFSVGNAYCQYLEEHFQFHTFFSKLNTQRPIQCQIYHFQADLIWCDSLIFNLHVIQGNTGKI